MIEVSVSERIEAPAAAVWSLIGDFNNVRRWVPGVEHSTKSGEGIGAERVLNISGGAKVVERLDAHDDGARWPWPGISQPVPAWIPTACGPRNGTAPEGRADPGWLL